MDTLNKSESKYFNTALKMDKAFLDLLAEKDFEYITVKEICQRAGVNRSTFYLHYETVADLLDESVENTFEDFNGYFRSKDAESFISNIKECPAEELMLITPQYLLPYLSYIRDNKRLFQTLVRHSSALGMDKRYQKMFECIFEPILKRFNIPAERRHYMMAFYINGIVALTMEWLKNNCAEPVEKIADIIKFVINPENTVP